MSSRLNLNAVSAAATKRLLLNNSTANTVRIMLLTGPANPAKMNTSKKTDYDKVTFKTRRWSWVATSAHETNQQVEHR